MSIPLIMTDDVYFENDCGERIGPFKTKFRGSNITVFNDKLIIKEGDIAIQQLPNGTEDRFIITNTQFNTGLQSTKAHYKISLVKESKQQREEKITSNTTVHISNSNVQVGDGNIQNIVNSFEQLTKEIESSGSTPEQKEEAKGLLKLLISNPTVAAVLGGAVSGLLGILPS